MLYQPVQVEWNDCFLLWHWYHGTLYSLYFLNFIVLVMKYPMWFTWVKKALVLIKLHAMQDLNRASSITHHDRRVNCVKEDNYLTLNYKRMKKKRDSSHNFLLSLVYVYLWILSGNLVSGADYSLQKCDAATQQNIFETLPQCEPRTSLVDLRQYFEDNHDIIQVNIKFAKFLLLPFPWFAVW